MTRTYIINSHKHWLRLRRRVVRIEAHYEKVPVPGGRTTPESTKETESITIVHTVAPLALPVTVFAMLGALAALEMKGKGTPDLAKALPTLILAAVVYNVYDLTDLRQKISGSLDWRGALVVGLTCGLLGGPMLTVLEGGFSKALDVDPASATSSSSGVAPSGPSPGAASSSSPTAPAAGVAAVPGVPATVAASPTP